MSPINPVQELGKAGALAYFQILFIQNTPGVTWYGTGMHPGTGAMGKRHFPDSLSCPQAVILTVSPLCHLWSQPKF